MIDASARTAWRLGAVAGVATLVADQASKFYLVHEMRLPESGPIAIAPFLDLAFVGNHGISYGLFQQDSDLGRWLLVGISLAAVSFIGAWLMRTRSAMTGVALGLIAGGALGNAIDRALYGAVVDFLHLHAGAVRWLDFPYIFNLADAAISVGAVFLLVESLLGRNKGLEQGSETR